MKGNKGAARAAPPYIFMERILTYTAEENYTGKNLKTLLKQRFKMSTALIGSLKRSEDGICVNGERKHVDYIIQPGDEVTLTMREGSSENIEPVKTELDIVYEDEDVIIINKPSGMPTHPSQGHHGDTLANGLAYYFQSKGEERVFRAVNRLDKDTSGLMAAAKNAYTHARLCDEIASGELKRSYTAIVCGDIAMGGVIDAPIGRAEGSAIERAVVPNGQNAVTHYDVLKRHGKYTLVSLDLETGRTHQIRVHMAHIGHPLLGDWLYGEENKALFPRVALHSANIRLIQPVTGESLEFSSLLPEDMAVFINSTHSLSEG